MPCRTNCPLYYDPYCSPLPWWLDIEYPCYQPPPQTLRRTRSYDHLSFRKPITHYREPDERVKIYVDVRYKHTSNRQTLLSNQVCIEINSRCCVMDVWQAAVRCNPHLRHYEPTHKVLATNSRQSQFTEICSQARIKDEYHKSKRHWVFVVHPPFKCVPKQKKKKKKKSTRPSDFFTWYS